jgi:hypothetical protein
LRTSWVHRPLSTKSLSKYYRGEDKTKEEKGVQVVRDLMVSPIYHAGGVGCHVNGGEAILPC